MLIQTPLFVRSYYLEGKGKSGYDAFGNDRSMYIKVKRLKLKFIKFAGGCCLRERAPYQRIRDKKQSQTILETGE